MISNGTVYSLLLFCFFRSFQLKAYEKELQEREKAVEDMLLVITQLKKLGKKIKLVDIDE